MTCEGCSNAIKRVIARVDGIGAALTVEASVAEKRVVVRGAGAGDARVLEALQKWGAAANKSVEAIAAPDAVAAA